MKKWFQCFIIFFFPFVLTGQKVTIAQVDPETGIISLGEVIPDITKISTNQGNSTYDAHGGNYILKTIEDDPLLPKYSIVNSDNSQIVKSINIPPKEDFLDEIFGLSYNSLSDSLFCIFYDFSEDLYQFMNINLEDGEMTVIRALSEFRSILSNSVLLDENNKRLVFKGIDNENGYRVFSIELSSGEIKSEVSIPETENAGNGLFNMQIDPSSAEVYGFQWDDESNEWLFVSLNYEEGNYEVLNNIPDLQFLSTDPKLYSIDPVNQRYFAKGQNANEEEMLYTISTESGALLHSVPFYTIGNVFTYFSDLEYDKEGGILYVLYVDTNLQPAGIIELENIFITISPNPTSSMVYIYFDQRIIDAEVRVMDMNGKILNTYQFKHIHEIPISLENYESGMYLLQINSDKNQIAYPIIKIK